MLIGNKSKLAPHHYPNQWCLLYRCIHKHRGIHSDCFIITEGVNVKLFWQHINTSKVDNALSSTTCLFQYWLCFFCYFFFFLVIHEWWVTIIMMHNGHVSDTICTRYHHIITLYSGKKLPAEKDRRYRHFLSLMSQKGQSVTGNIWPCLEKCMINSLRPECDASVNYAIIGSDNGLLPLRQQAIIWTNTGLLFTGS